MSALADRMRGLPQRLDERPTTVKVRTRTWASGRTGDTSGPVTDVDLLLTPTPRVREVSSSEIASSAGRYAVGDFKVGPVTPVHTGGGYTEAQLAPTTDESGVEVFYVLTGNVSGEYARVDIKTDASHSWILTLRHRRSNL